MKKLMVTGIIILLVGMSTISSGFDLEKASISTFDSNTLYVGGSGPGNYSNIQDAIDDASDGDTVFVFDDSSPYYENVVVDKSIILLGEDRNSTVIDGSRIDSVMEIYAENVHVEGFTITNCIEDLDEAGINIFSDNNIIKNNRFFKNQLAGIRLLSSNYNLIENNYFEDNIWYHLNIRSNSNNNTIKNNYLTASDEYPILCDGIWLSHSSGNLIENNEITNLKFTVGIALDSGSNHNFILNNIIHNNPCYNAAITIQIYSSDFNMVQDNVIRYNDGTGIMMLFSEGNKIIRNTIEFISIQGIRLGDCRYNNIIKSNNICSTKTGVSIGMYSSKNIIESNNLTNNIYGIHLSGTDLLGFCPNNVITKNNIFENEYGIYINKSKYYGYSNDSLIYNNNFIDNTMNAYDECSNMWNNSGFGNYWDDYDGIDANEDDIGDTPYLISGRSNQDFYPLMDPFGMTVLQSSIQLGLFKHKLTLRNIGNHTAFNVQWSMKIDGGIIFFGRESSGNVSRQLLKNEEIIVTLKLFLFGLGNIQITIDIWADNVAKDSETIKGRLFLFFLMI